MDRLSSAARPPRASRVAPLFAAIVLAAVPAGVSARPGGGGAPKVSHTALQPPPIQLGTSGGWGFDLANGYCCGGTLGALVAIGGEPQILSNYHVLAADIVEGGNQRVARPGDPVIQPGLIDVGCNGGGAQVVGTLARVASPADGNVDAATAAAAPGMVRADGAILEVGPPSTLTLPVEEVAVGMPVKKSGRTTRLTRSTVSGLYASVTVAYDDECAGGAAFTRTFTNQILLKNRGSKFLAGGDSGSLLLEDVALYPRAVGLLFAGSSLVAVANPIDEVLGALGGATIVGAAAVTGGAPVSAGVLEGVRAARAAQLRHVALLERIPDAVGHAVGLGTDGRVVLQVLVAADSPRARAAAPRTLDGVPVRVEVVGRIVAY